MGEEELKEWWNRRVKDVMKRKTAGKGLNVKSKIEERKQRPTE